MRPLLGLALLAGALLVAGSAGCASEDDGRTAGIIHRLLLAAATDEAGALESFVGRLPDELPVTPPLYPDADLIVSSRQPTPFTDFDTEPVPGGLETGTPQPVLYFIVLDTRDAREKVFRFYEGALDRDPWQLESSFSAAGLDSLQFFNVDDPDIAGVVTIARGGEDERTSVLISLQDAGAFREEEAPFEPEASAPLPKEFPPEVPVYEGAAITDAAFFREPATESFLLIFLTTDSQEEVIEFYREEFEQQGWAVLERAALGLEDRIDFRDDDRDIQGEVLADRYSRARSYTEVTIQVQVNPARDIEEPGEDEATPEPTAETEETPDEAASPR